jgi:acyl-CoA thioester hydrolase
MREKTDNGPYNIFAEAEITVEFYDLDPMRIVWHGNYINYFEIGRRKLLQKLGYDYYEMEESGYAFPIIEVSAKYLDSLRFKDRAIVKAILVEYENRLRIKYEIRNAETGVITTKGVSTQMAIDVKKNESCFVCPQILYDKVEAAIRKEKQ